MTNDDAAQVASWRYQDRWSVYDLESSIDILGRLDLYWSVTDADGDVIGFFCVGSAARVPGLDLDPAILDVGVGMDPRLVGQGIGRAFGSAVLEHVCRQFSGRPLRAVVQSWNLRSRRFAAGLGFVDIGEMSTTAGEQRNSFRVLLKPHSESSRGSVVAQSGAWLFGDRLMLRDFAVADERSVHAYASIPAVCRFTDWGPNSVADTRAFLAHAATQRQGAERAEFALAAVHVTSGTVIGSGAINVTSARHGRGELGYVINPDFWSQGYATEVAELLVQFGFGHLRLHRIEATCHPENGASARVLQKAGLRYEGLMRGHLIVRGVGRDSSLYAIVADDHDTV